MGTPATKLQLDHAWVYGLLSTRACVDIIFPDQHHRTPQTRTTRHRRPHAHSVNTALAFYTPGLTTVHYGPR